MEVASVGLDGTIFVVIKSNKEKPREPRGMDPAKYSSLWKR